MRILFDEGMPRALKDRLTEHQVATVQELGWSGLKNGELLKRADKQFDAMLTTDQNLRHQQNLKRFEISIVVFPSTHIDTILSLTAELKIALQEIARGSLIEL